MLWIRTLIILSLLTIPVHAFQPVEGKEAYKVRLGEYGDDAICGDTKFKPKLKLQKWGNESFIEIDYKEGSYNKCVLDGEKLKSVSGTEEVHFYQLDKDKLEFEIILNAPPPDNVFEFKVKDNGDVNYYYQPELSPAVISSGDERPDNIVGSYAVYHKTKKNNRYKVGKMFHIYRPKAIDALGKEEWCEFNTDLNKTKDLIITVPQTFLDTATYPIVIDPTFGYEGIGGTLDTSLENAQSGGVFTMGAIAGTADTLTFTANRSGTQKARGTIYLQSNLSLIAAGVEVDIDSGKAEYVSTLGSENLLANTDYILMMWGEGTVGLLGMYYDSGDVGDVYYSSTTGDDPYSSSGDPSNPLNSADVGNSRQYSIYCDYTTSTPTGISARVIITSE